MSLLGIDVGTTGVKAAAFNAEGEPISLAYREYAPIYPHPGCVELDSQQVVRDVKAAVAEAAAGAADDPVCAVCVSAMGEAATPVDADGNILGNCILSSDVRGQQYATAIEKHLGREGFYRINPNVLSASYTMPKLCWMRDHEPEAYARADQFLLWDGMVALALGCEPFASYSHANRTLLFDVHREDWSDELLAAAGIDRDKLPPCRPAGMVAGEVAPHVASELGLPRGVEVVVGGHDQCCNALGAGLAGPGKAVDGIGTYECITPVYERMPEAGAMLSAGLSVEHHVVPGLYATFIFNQAGSLVRWFRDTFAGERRQEPDIYDALVAEVPEAPTALLTLPYFEPTGSPGYVSDASGVIAGLKLSTRRGEILKSIMESATYYFASCLDRLTPLGIVPDELVATGGGARSDAWLQIKADIYGVPVTRPAFTECSLLGAAMVAGKATGAVGSLQEAASAFVSLDREFVPDTKRHRVYRERLAMYEELVAQLHPLLSRMSSMT